MAEIKSWRGFLEAVERMRELQKVYRRTKTPSSHASARRCEAEVDAVIRAKRAEWDKAANPDITGLEDKESGGRDEGKGG